MFEQILQLVKEHMGSNPQIADHIPPEQADQIHHEIATQIHNGIQNQPEAPAAEGGMLSELEHSLASGNLLTSAVSGGLVGSLAGKFGLSPAISGAIAAAIPGLVAKYMQKKADPAQPGLTATPA